ncbi:hypothetical protein QQX09_06005 [Demequina sp. SYSU T00192]|uniref:Membrane protein involved in the export of O-antigen and teichoic acid n=1 Tax=Demequina litoralis TaxID=3051660 RepID=A0ABT8G8D7_9MICO|nr:hypothetical protein [Demequina sp. SYSU T00192]MDN4475409.1 hypothetical protein [Demequina sp. SYSU T00192]
MTSPDRIEPGAPPEPAGEPRKYGRAMHLVRQFGWIGGGRIAAAAVQAAVLVIAARTTDEPTIALIAAAAGLLVFAQAVADLGISTLVLRERAAGADPGFIRACLRGIDVTSSALGVAVAIAAAAWILVAGAHQWWLVVLVLGAAAEKNAEGRMGLAVADGEAHASARVLVIRRVAILVAVALLVLVGMDGAWAYALGTLAGNMLGAALARRDSVRRAAGETTLEAAPRLPEIARHARPYYANSVSTQFRNLDALIVTTLGGPVPGAAYGLTSRLMTPLRILPTSLAQALLPSVAKGNHRSTRRFLSLVGLVVVGSAVVFGIGAATAALWVPWLFGQQYTTAVVPVQIALLGLPLAAAASLLAAALQGRGHPRATAWGALIGSTSCLVFVAIGVLAWEAPGASAGLTLSFALQAAFLLAATLRTKE